MIGNFVLRTSIRASLKSRNRTTSRLCLIAILMAAFSASLAHAQLTQLSAFQYNANTISNYPDGQSPVAVPCASTGSWTTVGYVTVPMTLTAGSNTVALSNPSANAPDIDDISVPLAP